MKRNKLKTRFGPEIRFEVVPSLNAPRRGAHEEELNRLTRRLLQRHLAGADSVPQRDILRHAAHDACALVWLTPFPLLFLPLVLEEKVGALRRQAQFQENLRRRCRPSRTEAA